MPSLRDFTNARVDLGRSGDSIPTQALLQFRLAHAQAKDAVHLPLDTTSLIQEFAALGVESIPLASQASNRHEYLRRPDLGRILSNTSCDKLTAAALRLPLVFCVADGLSAAAIHRHAAPLLRLLRPQGPIFIIEQGRVAIGDPIGQFVNAELCVLLIGERPGLSSPDSLGVYITYQPHPGCNDAARNCVSNIHDSGLSYELAAGKILYLLNQAKVRKLTGVQLKERAGLLETASSTDTPFETDLATT